MTTTPRPEWGTLRPGLLVDLEAACHEGDRVAREYLEAER